VQISGTDPALWRHHAWLNRLQSLLLLGFMGGFLALLGWFLWGGDGVSMLLIVGLVFVALNPAVSPRLIMHLYGARSLTPAQAPTLYAVLQELAHRAGLATVPALYYVPSRVVTAFTVGRKDQAAVAVTDGLLHALDTREQIAVLAHEVSHVRSNDMWVMGLADLFSRLTSVLSLFGQLLLLVNLPLLLMSQVTINWFAIVILIFAPHLSALAQLGLSRTREYDADLNASRLTGDPEGLARALTAIDRLQGDWLERVLLPGRRLPEPSLLRTHPPTQQRVARLLALQRSVNARHLPLRIDRPSGVDVLSDDGIRRAPRWHISGLWH
jgi:heat shock protein HtpX